MMSPFDYVLKQYTDEMIWIQWLGCSGRTQAGKSTIGRVACGIWGNYNSSRYNVQFTSVNREATLGRKLSESTLPINVQETEDLRNASMDKMRGMIKGCVQGRISRSKVDLSDDLTQIFPALKACIFSSNPPFPEDPGFRSKFIYIQHTRQMIDSGLWSNIS